MSIKIFNNDLKKVYFQGKEIKAVYFQNNKIYPTVDSVIPNDGAILWKDFTTENLVLTAPFTIGTNNGTGTYDSSNGAHGWFAPNNYQINYWDNAPHTAFATVNKVRYCLEIQVLAGSPVYQTGAIQKVSSKLSNGYPYVLVNGNPVEKTEVLTNGNIRISFVNSVQGKYCAPTRTGGTFSICGISSSSDKILSIRPISLYYYLL